MKAQTQLNTMVISATLCGPICCFGGVTLLVLFLRNQFNFSQWSNLDEWMISGLISVPFSLLLIIPLWLVCGMIFFTVDVDDEEGPRKIPTKWDEPNPEVEALIKKVEKRMEAKRATEGE